MEFLHEFLSSNFSSLIFHLFSSLQCNIISHITAYSSNIFISIYDPI